MTAYQVRHWAADIQPLEVERFTASFAILPNGRREGLSTDYSHIFESREHAVAWLRAYLQRKIENLEAELKRQRLALEKAV